MRGRVWILIAVLVFALVSAASASETTGTRIVRSVTPFTADGHVRRGLRIAREARGNCEPGSDNLPNNVYRCFSGNLVLDPCWRDWRSRAAAVICLEEPWARTVVRLRLVSTPPPSFGHTNLDSEPWGITLRSGARCIALQGAHDTLTGRYGSPVIDYYCGKYARGDLALVRGIRRKDATWTIRAARITGDASHPYALIGWIAVKTAWFRGNNPLSSRP